MTKLNAGVDNMMSDVYQTFIRPYIVSWYSLWSEILDVRKNVAFNFAKNGNIRKNFRKKHQIKT